MQWAIRFFSHIRVRYDWYIKASLNSISFTIKSVKYFHYYNLLELSTQQYTENVPAHVSMVLFLSTFHQIPTTLESSAFFSFSLDKIYLWYFYFSFHLILIAFCEPLPSSFKPTSFSFNSVVSLLETISWNANTSASRHPIAANESEFEADKRETNIFHCIN